MVSRKDFMKRICKGISLARFVVLLAVSSSFEGCLRREDTFQSQVWKEWTSRFSAEDFEIVTKLWLLVAWPPQRKGKQNVFRGNPEKERCPEWQLLWLHWDWFSKLAKARDVWFFPGEPNVGHAIRVLGSGGLSIRDLRKDESWKYTLRLGNGHKSLICSRDRSTQDEGVSGQNRCREPSHS